MNPRRHCSISAALLPLATLLLTHAYGQQFTIDGVTSAAPTTSTSASSATASSEPASPPSLSLGDSREPFPLPETPKKAASGFGFFGGAGVGADDVDAIPTPNPHPERKLLLAVELCRHGDRTPLYEYPNDAVPASEWPEGVGALTAVGERAHFELGRRLRKRYVDSGFLPFSFSAKDIYLRSTTIDRTLMSAYSQMAGMFPAGTGQVTDVGLRYGLEVAGKNESGLPLRWQPVPIHTVALKHDALLIPGGNCPRKDRLLASKLKGTEWVNMESQEQKLLEKLGEIVGVGRAIRLTEVNHVNDIWVVYEHHKVPLPEGVTAAIRKRVQEIATWLLLHGNTGDELRRLKSGLLLNEIKTRMLLSSRKAKGKLSRQLQKEVRKFVLYSAHDSTVAAALSALNVDFDSNPPYNSTLIWELFHDNDADKFLVSIEYNGKKMHVPGCPKPVKGATDIVCGLDDYLAATRAMTIASSAMRMRECLTGFRRQLAFISSMFKSEVPDGANDEYEDSPFDDQYHSVSTFRIVILGFLICIALFAAHRARRQYEHYFPVKTTESGDEASGERASPLFQGHRDRRILL